MLLVLVSKQLDNLQDWYSMIKNIYRHNSKQHMYMYVYVKY